MRMLQMTIFLRELGIEPGPRVQNPDGHPLSQSFTPTRDMTATKMNHEQFSMSSPVEHHKRCGLLPITQDWPIFGWAGASFGSEVISCTALVSAVVVVAVTMVEYADVVTSGQAAAMATKWVVRELTSWTSHTRGQIQEYIVLDKQRGITCILRQHF